MKQFVASLVFCDVARFDDEICLQFRNDPGKRTFMERSLPVFIDANVKRMSERLLPGEIPKSDRDMDIIELVIKSVKEYMVLYRRDKIIDIPPSFVHQVPENRVILTDQIFGGVVVEKNSNEKIFAINLFQKIFVRTCSWGVKVKANRQMEIFGEVLLKKGAASLISRQFLKDVVESSGFFKGNEFVDEKCFDAKAEEAFRKAFDDFWERGDKFLSKEDLFPWIIGGIINGAYTSYVGAS